MAARWTSHGRGAPVTLVVHGLGATEGEARLPSSGLPGTRVVLTLPGHGSAPDAAPGYWNYASIAGDVLDVAREVGATRAIGTSLGAGALIRIAAEHPLHFERLALLLPAALDRPREAAQAGIYRRLAEAVAAEDGGARLREILAEDIPAGVDVGGYVEQRAAALLRLGEALRDLPGERPLSDASVLAEVSAVVLVIGATDDPLHPAEVAKATAAALPRSRLDIIESRAPMLTHRRTVRGQLVDFLS